MKIITFRNRDEWNQIIKSFPQWDIYYLYEYAESLQGHGDGVPILIYSEEQKGRLAYVMMQNDIAEFSPFCNNLDREKYYDWTTPYGYGGPLLDGNVDAEWMENFIRKLKKYCREHNIVTQFFRYHPLLQNQKLMESCCDVIYMKKTIYIDTEDEELIFKNMTPNNRNMVRKARKNNVTVFWDRGEHLDEFLEIYTATMDNHHATDYYYFERTYFEYLIKQMEGHLVFFYAVYEGQIISTSIFLYNDRFMHYHLSGTLPQYRKLAGANLVLTEAANWAAKHKIKEFHLGGGVDEDDSLLRFKKHFNRNGEIDFCIGRTIFDQEKFDFLVEQRKQVDPQFDDSKRFLIKYRL